MLRRHCKTCRTPLHAAWVAYQYKVLPFRLSLAPRNFTRCMDAAFSPLRQMRICILNYLDDWLILAQSEAVSTSYKIFLISHLGCLGLRVNFITKSILVTQPTSFIPGHSYRLSADDSNSGLLLRPVYQPWPVEGTSSGLSKA